MKKFIFMAMVVVMCFGFFGCGNGSAKAEKETNMYINDVSGAKEMMEQGPTNKNEWAIVIPDYETIFKNGSVDSCHTSANAFDYLGIFSMVINDVTEEEYNMFVSEAAKIYSNVISESNSVIDGEPFYGYHALDATGLYQLDVSLYSDEESGNLELLVMMYHFEEPKEI